MEIVFILVLTAAFSYLLTPLGIHLAHKLGLVDDPDKRTHPAQVHKGIIPRAGGLTIFIAIACMTLYFVGFGRIPLSILGGGFLLVLIGLIDDKIDLPPAVRFLVNFIAAAIAVSAGIGIPYVTNPFGGIIHLDHFRYTFEFLNQSYTLLLIADIFAILWIAGLMNFVSWSSAVDGQLGGFVGISSIFIGLTALRFSAHDISSIQIAILAFVTAGAFIGFTPWSFYPQKIMPGYSGGTLAGYLLAVLSILSFSKLGVLAMVLAIPIVDATYVIIRRIVQKKSPLKGDSGHFHHRLLSIGWGKRRIAVFYWLVSLLFGIASLYLEGVEKVLALLTVYICIAVFIVAINKMRATQSAKLKGQS